jgi:hypothetical protein
MLPSVLQLGIAPIRQEQSKCKATWTQFRAMSLHPYRHHVNPALLSTLGPLTFRTMLFLNVFHDVHRRNITYVCLSASLSPRTVGRISIKFDTAGARTSEVVATVLIFSDDGNQQQCYHSK